MNKRLKPISYTLLRKRLNPKHLHFRSTRKVKKLNQFLGQERALAALRFGIGIQSHGYNLFAMGPVGIGKRSLIEKVLENHTKKKPVPSDWCYVHNFEIPEKPIALKLPAGKGYIFQQDMKKFVDKLITHVVLVFESDEYQNGMKIINKKFEKNDLKESSISTNTKIHRYYKEKYTKEKSLQLRLLKVGLQPLVVKLKKKYRPFPKILTYINNVQKDIFDHAEEFFKTDDEKTISITISAEHVSLIKYKVNLFINNGKLKKPPIIFENNPYYSDLICRVEYLSEQGNFTTNFTLIKPGSLHRANGGYLLIEMRKLKKNKEAWEALKNALYTNQIKIEVEHTTEEIKPISLDPEPIPLNIKIILLGSRNTYYSLCQKDDDFGELFKVAIDFDEEIERNKKNISLYARLISTIIKKKNLKHFSSGAVAEIIDHSSRLAEDNEKLSTSITEIEDLIIEADYWASNKQKQIVGTEDVKKAIHAQAYRMDRAKELYQEDIHRGFIIIKTKGKTIGQVNCLSVRKVGNFSYGHPTRVTARIHLGNNKFIDIQREIKLAGPFHSKAGLIIANFLASRFSQEQIYAISASISFEQLYCWTDGDSASLGELCALLSALAKIPIYQFLAVTGSIDQYGRIQAVGGLNEKIEGFFDICCSRGLTGQQGVIIPAVNEKNLMLKDDVIDAVREKKFNVYTVKAVDEAVAILTGWEAGKRDPEGHFPPHTVYGRVEAYLSQYAKKK